MNWIVINAPPYNLRRGKQIIVYMCKRRQHTRLASIFIALVNCTNVPVA